MSETINRLDSTPQPKISSEPLPFTSALKRYLEVRGYEESLELAQMLQSMTKDEKAACQKELEEHGYKILDPADVEKYFADRIHRPRY